MNLIEFIPNKVGKVDFNQPFSKYVLSKVSIFFIKTLDLSIYFYIHRLHLLISNPIF